MTTDPRLEAAMEAILEGASNWENDHTNIRDKTTNFAKAVLDAVDAVDPLRKPGHLVEIRDDAWTLQHPPECRPDMLACPLNGAIRRLDPSSYHDGIWHVELDADGLLEFRYRATK